MSSLPHWRRLDTRSFGTMNLAHKLKDAAVTVLVVAVVLAAFGLLFMAGLVMDPTGINGPPQEGSPQQIWRRGNVAPGRPAEMAARVP